MKIGIDIDNVISDMASSMYEEYLKHDKELRNTGIVDANARIRFGMFDWSKEEEEEFYYSNIERIATNFKLIPKSKETIDKLKKEGNEIYIITGRDNGEYSDPWNMTVEWLKKHEIHYDKLILTNVHDKHAKTIECKKHGVDIMIDDNISICLDAKENGIKVLAMNTRTNMTDDDLERVNNWEEIYEKIKQLGGTNEVD